MTRTRRDPPIPGTSSAAPHEESLAAARIQLSANDLNALEERNA